MASSPPRRPGRPSQPIDRRALLAIAARAFAERGYAAASLSEIATAAGLRKASLYHHFPAKDDLYRSVLDAVVEDLRALVLAARLAAGEWGERLDRLGELTIDYLADNPYAARLIVRELVGESDYARGSGGHDVLTSLHAVTAFFAAGMEAGAFRRQDPRHLALSIVGLHVYYFATPAMSGALLAQDVFAAEAVRARKVAVLAQVRALCLADAAPLAPAARKPVRGRPR